MGQSSSGALAGQEIALVVSDEDAAILTPLLGRLDVAVLRLGLGELHDQIPTSRLMAAIVASDLLSRDQVSALARTLSMQLPWLDFPIIMLIERSEADASEALASIDQLRVIERPIHPAILNTAVRSAMRSRTLQRQALASSREAVDAQSDLHRMSEDFETSVEKQITSLKALSDRLAREVEERRRAEERLRESEELYRYTVELSKQMVWTASPDGFLTSVGPRFHEVTGVAKDQPLNGTVSELVHPDDLLQLRRSWKEALSGGTPHMADFRMRVAGGQYRMFSSRAAPRRDDKGRIVRWYGFTEDVHEQKLANEAVREAEERYRLASRATNDAIWDWNLVTDHIAWSEAALTFLGSEPASDSDIEWWERNIHPEDRPRVLRSIRSAIESEKSRWSSAYRLKKADGDYAYVYDRGFIIRNEEGLAVRAVGAVVDLTERRRAEADLRRAQQELIHVSRVSAMGTMASTLAHELNQPLTAVTSYVRGSRRLLSGSDDPKIQQVCEALEFAEAGALRAGQIVRRLRELVARGNVAVCPEDLGKLIEDASVLAFVDEHLHGISHRIMVDETARWVEADRVQIQQVLINLIRNAVQAMQHSDEREVVIATRAGQDGMVEVSVSDTGGGIPASVRDALFSPFHSTKSEGLGIGLSISRTIVEAHHGKIWADDNQGRGAVFRFTLPRADIPIPDDLPEVNASPAESSHAV